MSKVIGRIIGAILTLFSVSFVIMLLWNVLMPVIFSLTVISYWQGMGLYMLANIFFKPSSVKVWFDK